MMIRDTIYIHFFLFLAMMMMITNFRELFLLLLLSLFLKWKYFFLFLEIQKKNKTQKGYFFSYDWWLFDEAINDMVRVILLLLWYMCMVITQTLTGNVAIQQNRKKKKSNQKSIKYFFFVVLVVVDHLHITESLFLFLVSFCSLFGRKFSLNFRDYDFGFFSFFFLVWKIHFSLLLSFDHLIIIIIVQLFSK